MAMNPANSTSPTNSTNSRNARAELLDAFCQMFRAVARPGVTIIFAAVIAQAVVQGIDVPQWFLGLAIPVITWWFAERALTHVKERND